jgi:hypothetical protein
MYNEKVSVEVFQEKAIDFAGKSVIETTLYSVWFHTSETTGFDYQWMMKPRKCSRP